MANDPKMALIEKRAKDVFPNSEELQDAFVSGAMWDESSHWRKVTDEKPEEGAVVFVAYDCHQEGDGIHVSMNIAKFQDGKFYSYTDSDPELWCYPPLFVEKQD